MIREQSRWVVAEQDERQERQADALASALSLSPLAARLLVQRGFGAPEEADAFLNGGPERLHDPYLLKGMEQAVQRIRRAADSGERIRVYGDYDADGVSSTALMIGLLNALGCIFDTYIPHRTREGYGLNLPAIDLAAEAGVTLIVTVDTGISAVEQIAYAGERGIDVVVTDHHEPPETLPAAWAIVNPKQPGCTYPFKGLAGAGVAFKLGQALLGRPPLEWADRAALGTIADLMPLTDENRVIVRCGLEVMRRSPGVGVRALAEVSGVELRTVTASAVAFSMAPRINASGRLAHADKALSLLVTEDEQEAGMLASELDLLNRERQRIVDDIVREAGAIWQARCERARADGEPEPAVMVVAGEGWNPGVVGIVASKLIERTYKPALVLGIDPDTGKAKGSARSIEGFDLHGALAACEELMDHYGGHQMAAGMTLPRANLAELERRLSELARERVAADDWVRKTPIDMVCRIAEADLAAVEQIGLLEPFGAGNPQPRLLLAGVGLKERRLIGKDSRHLRLTAGEGGRTLEAIGFGMGHLAERIADGASLDLVGELTVNEWNGSRKPQLLLRELRIPHVQLFDRRGERDPVAVLKRLLEARVPGAAPVYVLGGPQGWEEAAAGGGAEASIVRLAWPDDQPYGGAAAAEAGGSAGAAAARADAAAGVGPAAPADACRRCRVLALLEEPPSAAALQALLGALGGLEAVYALYPGRSPRAAVFPDRQQFGAVYQALRKLPQGVPVHELPQRLAHTGWPAPVIRMMTEVFAELAFIDLADGTLRFAASPAKRELSASVRFRAAEAGALDSRLWHAPGAELATWIRRHASPS